MPAQFEGSVGLYGGASGSNKNVDSPWWAKKLGRFLKTLFNPDALHPIPSISDSNVSTGLINTNSISSMANAWRVHQQRKTIYQDIDRMDYEDEIVATALDIIADCSVAYSEEADFKFKISAKNPKIQQILDNLSRKLDLKNEIWQISRDMVKHGNEMREVVIDRNAMEIVSFKQTISYQVYPRINKHGDKVPGWIVKTDGDIYTGKEYSLEEWQIIPFIFGAKSGFLSVPPLASARRNWIRLTKIEDGMAIARLIRAYDKMVHRIPVKSDMSRDEIITRIRNYKDAISKRRILDSSGSITQVDDPLDVQTDFYLPDDGTARGGVELLSANNAQLGNLNDVIYAREKLLSRLQVPLSYLQLTTAQKTHLTAGGNKKSDVELQFARMLCRVQRHLKKGLYRLFDIELMLKGITPEEGMYELELTKITTKDVKEDAQIELTYAQAAVYFVEAFGSLPPELLAEKFMRLDPDQKILLESFLGIYNDRITKARVKSLETKAKPATPFGGNGKNLPVVNPEKPPKQSIELDILTDLMYDITDEINQEFRNQGIEVPLLDESHRNVIRTSLMEITGREVT